MISGCWRALSNYRRASRTAKVRRTVIQERSTKYTKYTKPPVVGLLRQSHGLSVDFVSQQRNVFGAHVLFKHLAQINGPLRSPWNATPHRRSKPRLVSQLCVG